MTDENKTMPEKIWAWKNQSSINVENYSSGKCWSSVDECENTEFYSAKYISDDIHQAALAERDELKALCEQIAKGLDECLCELWDEMHPNMSLEKFNDYFADEMAALNAWEKHKEGSK